MATSAAEYQPLPPGAVSGVPQYGAATVVPSFVVQRSYQWSTGLYDVLDPDCATCCDTLWCGHCQVAYQYHRLRHPTVEMDPFICLVTSLLDATICMGCARVAATYSVRTTLAARYGIPQSCFWDGCTAVCCNPCALCQQQREMTRHDEFPGGVCVKHPVVLMAPPTFPVA